MGPTSMEERILGALGCPCSWEALIRDLGLEMDKDGVTVFAHLRALIECGSVVRVPLPAGGAGFSSDPSAIGTYFLDRPLGRRYKWLGRL